MNNLKGINLSYDPNTGKMIFQFLNGEVVLNEKYYGAYAMCPGCGSGKTTIVKQLIALKWQEGVVYAAFTKNEVDEMYQWCVDNLVNKSTFSYVDNDTGMLVTLTLRESDIAVLHSNYSAEGTDRKLWEEHPEDLKDKKIILCTHHKLLYNPVSILVNYNLADKTTRMKSSQIKTALQGLGNLPRQWIIIDEGLESNNISRRVSKTSIASLSTVATNRKITSIDPNTGKEVHTSVDLPRPIFVCGFPAYGLFKGRIYDMYRVSNGQAFKDLVESDGRDKEFKDPNDPSKTVMRSPIGKLRDESILGELYDNFPEYANSEYDPVKITYGFNSWSVDNMRTHVILLDGTSDITLSNSNRFKLLTYENKYNSLVSLKNLSFSLSRKVKPDRSIPDLNYYLRSMIDIELDGLKKIISDHEKTLIFTWMDFKFDNSEVNDDASDGLIAENKTMVSGRKGFLLPEYMRFELTNSGIDPNKFSIEYYGSGMDKATNKYREYDCVVLFGKYTVPTTVIRDFNLAYNTNITGVEYYANRVVQAICRTRIRLHQGLPIDVYMTSDWSPEVKRFVARYLNTGEILSSELTDERVQSDINYMRNGLRSKGITPKKAEQIARLSVIDPNIYRSIMEERVYKTNLSLDKVYDILPMSRKESDKYSRLTASLKSKYLIDVTIS